MIRVAIILSLCVAYTYTLTTTVTMPETTTKHHHRSTHAHVSHEPNEKESYTFVYEAHTHQMVVVSGQSCYIFTLTDDERMAVHTDSGISTLELKLLGLLSTGTQTSTTKDQLDHHLASVCGHRAQHFFTVA